MTLLVLGLSHRTAPLDVLDAVAVPADLTAKALASVMQREHVLEAVVLSTCNRVEIYANVARYHGGVADLREHFAEWGGLAMSDFAHLAYDRFDRDAAEHLFAVASGLDSMVVGERQIHAQIRQAYSSAIDEGATGTLLGRVFEQAVRVGRRTRAETSIDQGAASIVDLALTTAEQHLAGTPGRVLLVGAGKIGGMVGNRVAEQGMDVSVVNRTIERAENLVERVGGTAHPLEHLDAQLAHADLVVTSTDAKEPLITADSVHAAMATRPTRPLVLVDLAVPRDVEDGVHAIPGVSVVNIDSLRRVVAQGPTGDAVRHAKAIIAEEAEEFLRWTRGIQAGPTIGALRRRAEAVRQSELERLSSKLSTLDDDQRQAVEALTKGILNTFLHQPTVRLKTLIDTPDGERFVRALDHLFDLAGEVGGADSDG